MLKICNKSLHLWMTKVLCKCVDMIKEGSAFIVWHLVCVFSWSQGFYQTRPKACF